MDPARGLIFNEVADLYDEVRPGYPVALIDALVARAELPADANVLEIGCGTGQFTVPLAARGFTILALEPGDALAALAVRRCQAYPRVRICPSTFENWPVQRGAFDLVVAAQSFHWLDPKPACDKAAVALRAGGSLAVVTHVNMSRDTLFAKATLPLYETFFPPAAPGNSRRTLRAALASSGVYGVVHAERHAWEQTYAGPEYLKLLHTFSDHRALSEPQRARFFDALAGVIAQFGGTVHRKYETVLVLARHLGRA